MSLSPPPPERSKVGDTWVDPITPTRTVTGGGGALKRDGDASTLLFPLAEKLLAAAATRRDIHGLVAVSPDLLRASAARIVAQESAIERVRNEAPDYIKTLVRDV